jgi:hypothetical protein
VLGADGTVTLNRRLAAALPVDVAISPDGTAVGAMAPGDGFVQSLSSASYLDQGGHAHGRTDIGTTAHSPSRSRSRE